MPSSIPSSLNDRFRDSIKNDFRIYDGKVDLYITHFEGDSRPSFTGPSAGTVSRVTKSILVKDCLFRQASLRNGPSVPQLHTREVAIQKDSFASIDVVIEVPRIEDFDIKDEDTIEEADDTGMPLENGRRWKVSGVDYSTLNTRYRLGCIRLRG